MTLTPKLIALEAVLLGFLAFSGYAVWEHGYVGFFELILANSATTLALTDLTICLSLIALWMWKDGQESDTPVAPYLVMALLLGGAGPLAYLIHKEVRAQRRVPVHA